MKKLAFASILALSSPAFADPLPITVTLGGIENGKPIPTKFAYCMPDGSGKTTDGGNINPAVSWSGAPDATKSYAIIVVDPDVPASFDKANKDGETIPADFPRRNFYHWVLVDIPPAITSIAEGADSQGVTKNRPAGKTEYGVNGLNSYPSGGYNGPCPPWNDERIHHYHFKVMALDVKSLNLTGSFTGKDAEKAIDGHIIAEGEAVGTYTNKK